MSTLPLWPGRPPAWLGLPVAGLLWSFASMAAQSDRIAALGFTPAEAAPLVVLGGLTLAAACWLSFTAVLWAMVRAFGGAMAMLSLAERISAAAGPLWFAAPLAALALNGAAAALTGPPALAALLWFLAGLGRELAPALRGSPWRGSGAAGAAALFLASFAYLTL